MPTPSTIPTRQVVLCCFTMKKALKENWLSETDGMLEIITDCYDDPVVGHVNWDTEPIKFCPFCGKKVEAA